MEERYDGYVEVVNDELRNLSRDVEPDSLSDAVEHVALAGGKRLRPLLTLLSFEAVTDTHPDTDLDVESQASLDSDDRDPRFDEALRFAAGVELVHTSALVADDIIDRSDVRRGVETVHESYGHDFAVLTSNMLLGKALETIDNQRAVSAMIDAVENLGEGEAMELSDDLTTVDDYYELAYKKTGSLFVASCEVGAIAGGVADDADEMEALREYAENLGVAFQIRDDVLDYTSTQEDLGKPVGKDAVLERPSLVAVHSKSTDSRLSDSVEFALGEADERSESAKRALDGLESESKPVDELRRIAEFAVERSR
ncbi:MAG: polyprenyl synthetase family protein [Halobacteria archaeon]|nr:polyprenyl synthetase family protein [Halobacteria archaeon]